MDSGAGDIFTAFKKLSLSPAQLTAVLLTHWHNDHAAGAAELKARLGVSIHYATEDASFFTRESASHGFRAWLGEKIPELGPLVLLRGLLEEAPPRAWLPIRSSGMAILSPANFACSPRPDILRATSPISTNLPAPFFVEMRSPSLAIG